MRCMRFVKIAVLLWLSLPLRIGGSQVYWTDIIGGPSSVIRRANLDGSGMVTLVTGLQHPRGMAVDVNSGKLYWAETGLFAIRRMNLDGTGGIENLAQTQIRATGVAIDPGANKMYWVSPAGAPGNPLVPP